MNDELKLRTARLRVLRRRLQRVLGGSLLAGVPLRTLTPRQRARLGGQLHQEARELVTAVQADIANAPPQQFPDLQGQDRYLFELNEVAELYQQLQQWLVRLSRSVGDARIALLAEAVQAARGVVAQVHSPLPPPKGTDAAVRRALLGGGKEILDRRTALRMQGRGAAKKEPKGERLPYLPADRKADERLLAKRVLSRERYRMFYGLDADLLDGIDPE